MSLTYYRINAAPLFQIKWGKGPPLKSVFLVIVSEPRQLYPLSRAVLCFNLSVFHWSINEKTIGCDINHIRYPNHLLFHCSFRYEFNSQNIRMDKFPVYNVLWSEVRGKEIQGACEQIKLWKNSRKKVFFGLSILWPDLFKLFFLFLFFFFFRSSFCSILFSFLLRVFLFSCTS